MLTDLICNDMLKTGVLRMKRNLYVCLVIGLFLLVTFNACTSSVGKENVVKLNHVFLLQDSSILGVPWFVFDDKMVLGASRNPVYEYCKLAGDSLVELDDFAYRGNGPYEFRFPDCYVSVENRRMYVGNWNNDKMFVMEIPVADTLPGRTDWKRIELADRHPEANHVLSGSHATWCAIDDSTYLVTGGESLDVLGAQYTGYENFLSIVSQGEIRPLEGLTYPDSGRIDVPIFVKRLQVYNYVNLFKRPMENQYALVGTNMGRYLILFKIVDGKAEQVKVVLDDFPQYGLDESGVNCQYDVSQKEGFSCAYATSQYIYLLEPPFSSLGERRAAKDYKGYPASYSDRIVVYDWEGIRAAVFELDVPVNNFVVSDDGSCIYASCADLENLREGVAKFAVPAMDNEVKTAIRWKSRH